MHPRPPREERFLNHRRQGGLRFSPRFRSRVVWHLPRPKPRGCKTRTPASSSWTRTSIRTFDRVITWLFSVHGRRRPKRRLHVLPRVVRFLPRAIRDPSADLTLMSPLSGLSDTFTSIVNLLHPSTSQTPPERLRFAASGNGGGLRWCETNAAWGVGRADANPRSDRRAKPR